MTDALNPRTVAWAQTMAGHAEGDVVRAHRDSHAHLHLPAPIGREAREERERLGRPGATFSLGRRHPGDRGGARRRAHLLRARP